MLLQDAVLVSVARTVAARNSHRPRQLKCAAMVWSMIHGSGARDLPGQGSLNLVMFSACGSLFAETRISAFVVERLTTPAWTTWISSGRLEAEVVEVRQALVRVSI